MDITQLYMSYILLMYTQFLKIKMSQVLHNHIREQNGDKSMHVN